MRRSFFFRKEERRKGIFLRFIKCRHFHGDVADKKLISNEPNTLGRMERRDPRTELCLLEVVSKNHRLCVYIAASASCVCVCSMPILIHAARANIENLCTQLLKFPFFFFFYNNGEKKERGE